MKSVVCVHACVCMHERIVQKSFNSFTIVYVQQLSELYLSFQGMGTQWSRKQQVSVTRTRDKGDL